MAGVLCGRCAECRFWTRRDYNPDADTPRNWDEMSAAERSAYRQWGTCTLAGSGGGKAEHPDSRAVALDYERYSADLLTHEDFGCVQFEQRLVDENPTERQA